jgi:glycosyltransferase involved in cell wall biosynthesis
VRNQGIKKVTTEWVGFVDDDDILSPLYVYRLKTEIEKNKNVDCVLFRMIYKNKDWGGDDYLILPSPGQTTIEENKVGISFCYKTIDYMFEPSPIEDYLLLNRFVNDKKKILISKYIVYSVNGDTFSEESDKIIEYEKQCVSHFIN